MESSQPMKRKSGRTRERNNVQRVDYNDNWDRNSKDKGNRRNQ